MFIDTHTHTHTSCNCIIMCEEIIVNYTISHNIRDCKIESDKIYFYLKNCSSKFFTNFCRDENIRLSDYVYIAVL